MLFTVLGRSLQHLSCSGVYLLKTCPAFLKISYLHLPTHRMATSDDFARLKARAEQTDRILADLQAQIETIKKSAVKQAGLEEENKLLIENENLKKEINDIKRALILAEIENGVRQIPLPTKGIASASLANGTASDSASKPKPKKEAGEKTKQPDPSAAGGKKIKVEKKGKEDKGDAGDTKSKKTSAAADDGDGPMDVSRLDIRVGKIVAVEKHPDADTLYVEQVDLGEGRNRSVVSGLVKHFSVNAMKDRIAVFLCNLKPAKIRGVLSEAMILCAVGPEKTEILVPPTDSVIGDRIVVQEYPGTPDEQLNPKKKIWETLKPDVRTNQDRIATFKGAHWSIPGKGLVVAPTLGDTQIS